MKTTLVLLRSATVLLLISGLSSLQAGKPWTPPAGFHVAESTLSPDGTLGVLAPDFAHYKEDGPAQNQLVNVNSGEVLATISAPTFFEDPDTSMNNTSLAACWSKDGSVLAWVIEGKWFPTTCVLLKVEDGAVAWQSDVLAKVQPRILAATRKTVPANYAAARKQNDGNGSAYPEGFGITVDTPQAGFSLPWKGQATLESNLKDIGEGWPPAANVTATMNFVVKDDGSVGTSNFQVDETRTGVSRGGDEAAAEESTDNKAAATPAPDASSPAADSATVVGDIRDWIDSFLAFENSNDLDGIVRGYSDKVTYLGHGEVDQDFIRKDQAALMEEWPWRSEACTGEIKVKPAKEDGVWKVSFPSRFYFLGAERNWTKGNAQNELTVELSGDTYAISAQSRAVSGQKEGRDYGQTFAFPRKDPAVLCEIPKSWNPKRDRSGKIEAVSDDGLVCLTIEAIKPENTDAALAANRALLNQDGLGLGEPAVAEGSTLINTIPMIPTITKGSDDNGPCTVTQDLWTVSDKLSLLVSILASDKIAKKNAQTIEDIRHHITPATEQSKVVGKRADEE